MRVVLQRVSEAKVVVDGSVEGAIGSGLLILLGVEEADVQDDIDWLVKKINQLRIFNDGEGKMNLSVQDVDGSFLVVSQFTLFAATKKGNRPSFIRSAKPKKAEVLYEHFKKALAAESGKPVECGIFGADMKVFLVNDGPVTIWMDTKNKE
ncbi:MAG: D-tyrosyl-tRNA(Tyr) deacylase [Saprospiraceae bacterium]|nr:D-tyrosyl-tRNA(Tyr) deacylase [Saprospiraceae bacterium]